MYPDLTVVWITAEPELVAARLARRGRESARGIAARLEHSAGAPAPAAARVVHINNSGALAAAGEKLLALLARPR
jgi:ribose 1,5-bisphosphokinase